MVLPAVRTVMRSEWDVQITTETFLVSEERIILVICCILSEKRQPLLNVFLLLCFWVLVIIIWFIPHNIVPIITEDDFYKYIYYCIKTLTCAHSPGSCQHWWEQRTCVWGTGPSYRAVERGWSSRTRWTTPRSPSPPWWCRTGLADTNYSLLAVNIQALQTCDQSDAEHWWRKSGQDVGEGAV